MNFRKKTERESSLPFDRVWPLIAAGVLLVLLQNVLLVFMLHSSGIADYLYAVGIVLILLLQALASSFADARVKEIKQRKQELDQRMMSYYARQYEAMNRFRQKTAEDRHERKNRTIALLALLREKDYSTLEKLLTQEQESLVRKPSGTGNMTVDAVLEYETALAAAKGIVIRQEIAIPTSMDVSPSILAGVLGNGLDNAIEAASLLPGDQRKVSLYMKVEKRNLFIVIKNSYDGYLNMGANGLLISRKDNAKEHGIGLKTIKELASQTGGFAEFYADEQEFTLRVLLCHAI